GRVIGGEAVPQPVRTGLARQCLPEGAAVALISLQRGADDWATLLWSLAQLYVAGAPVDWAGFDRDYPRRKVSLPTYPFQRQRFWVGKSRRPHANGASLVHPLLGPVMRSAAHGDYIFETAVSAVEPSWLGEHRVFGVAVVPGAAY